MKYLGEPWTEKRCPRCETTKPAEDFHKHTSGMGLLQSYCIRCTEDRRYQKYYGLTIVDYEAMVEAQGGRCGVCGRGPGHDGRAKLMVDHDHETGQVRALLCSHCNTALGMAEDDPDRLIALAAYIIQHRA
jgi:hypothetical protein